MTDQNHDALISPDKSKSQLKREANELQKLGEKLVALPRQVLEKLEMPDLLRQAINDAKRLNSRSAIRRQRQYIGRLMRELETDELVRQLMQHEQLSSEKNSVFHLIESWRDRIVDGADEVINDFLTEYPAADRQKLRQLSRKAQMELNKAQAPAAARQLFKYLREIIEQ